MSGIRVGIQVQASTTSEWLAGHLPRLVEQATARVVHRHGALLQTFVRKAASTGYHPPGLGHIPGTGPGPNVATGDYRRSITLATGRTPDGSFARVSTNSPQAWRLERGFVGTDSRGRRYRQQAYPHWGPAVDKVEPLLEAALGQVMASVADATKGRPITVEGAPRVSVRRPG